MRHAVLALVTACGGSPAPGAPDARAVDATAAVDGETPDASADAAATTGTYRDSLAICWTDASCPRVFALAHGGAWDVSSAPYDSNAALAGAFADGDDGVKIDVRVSKDNVPVIAHSSPIEIYESLDCANKKIEDMTAAEVTGCHRFPSSTETFQRLDDVLGYLRGKMVVQLCVKQVTDFGRTIDEIHTLGAEDFAFVEINAGDVPGVVGALPGSETVWYLVNVASDLGSVATILARHDPRLFMIEIDPGVTIGSLVTDTIHPAGARAFVYDNAASPSVDQLHAHYQAGFDAVSSQSGTNGVQARQLANTDRGVAPP